MYKPLHSLFYATPCYANWYLQNRSRICGIIYEYSAFETQKTSLSRYSVH